MRLIQRVAHSRQPTTWSLVGEKKYVPSSSCAAAVATTSLVVGRERASHLKLGRSINIVPRVLLFFSRFALSLRNVRRKFGGSEFGNRGTGGGGRVGGG